MSPREPDRRSLIAPYATRYQRNDEPAQQRRRVERPWPGVVELLLPPRVAEQPARAEQDRSRVLGSPGHFDTSAVRANTTTDGLTTYRYGVARVFMCRSYRVSGRDARPRAALDDAVAWAAEAARMKFVVLNALEPVQPRPPRRRTNSLVALYPYMDMDSLLNRRVRFSDGRFVIVRLCLTEVGAVGEDHRAWCSIACTMSLERSAPLNMEYTVREIDNLDELRRWFYRQLCSTCGCFVVLCVKPHDTFRLSHPMLEVNVNIPVPRQYTDMWNANFMAKISH